MTSLLYEATLKARTMSHGLQTYPEITAETTKRITQHLESVKCPILLELLLTYYKHPTNMAPSDAAKVLMNHTKDASWKELPIHDVFANKLFRAVRKESGLWNLICITFENVYRHDIHLIPALDPITGPEIVVYSFDTRLYTNFSLDLPQWFAVDMIARDPKILEP